MGFSVMLWGAEKLAPAEYWCPYSSSFALTPLRQYLQKMFISIPVIENNISSENTHTYNA